MNFDFSDKVKDLQARLTRFMEERIYPAEPEFAAEVDENRRRGNPWVPYPFSYTTWEALAHQNGFISTQLLEKRPSRFLGEIYSAVSLR